MLDPQASDDELGAAVRAALDAVLEVAGAWSIDPRALGRVPSETETGIFGSLPER